MSCSKSASPSSHAVGAGAVCFSHQSPVWPESFSVACVLT